MLLDVPMDTWAHIEMEGTLGKPDPAIGGAGLEDRGTWTLRVTLPDQQEQVLEDLAVVHEEFHDLRCVGFISLATERTRFFLNNVSIGLER